MILLPYILALVGMAIIFRLMEINFSAFDTVKTGINEQTAK